MSFKMMIFICLNLLLAFSCVINGTTAKDWINRPPYNFEGEKIEYTVLSRTYEKEYFELLIDKQFIEIDEGKYKEITGNTSKKRYTIVVRAVYTNRGGEYYVLQNTSQDISIKYYVLGRIIKVNKSILLLETDILPKAIYVSYTGAL